MKIILINGSPNQKGCTYTALSEVAFALEKEGVESEIIWLGKRGVPDCTDCGYCEREETCVFDDEVNRLLLSADEWDGLVVGSPVYYAGPSGAITSFLNRLFFAGGRKMVGKVGAAVVSCRRGGATAAFDRLNKYFSISNMIIATSQYWNQVHGSTAEEVKRDLEGMQTMRRLGANIAYLLKLQKAGEKAGISLPEPEPREWTNFIR
ncbi:MAG TPA: flavodoxin family protein [Fastidiosipila sp.]|nr:flavodoxin family protein [Fastidiosipila sp.]